MNHSLTAFPPRRFLTFLLLLIGSAAFIGAFYKAYQSYSLLNGVFFPVQMLLLLMCVYTFLPALAYLLFRKKVDAAFETDLKGTPQYKDAFHDFIILIPAHNEALTLPALLASIQQLIYPKDKLKVIVIADNCNDNTPFIARNSGAIVFERLKLCVMRLICWRKCLNCLPKPWFWSLMPIVNCFLIIFWA
jgi:cellulose synthase/poly-beta-1,6-N-acetylglucosamine synthase-like glycosyltransferase